MAELEIVLVRCRGGKQAIVPATSLLSGAARPGGFGGDLEADVSYKAFYLSATPKAARHAHLSSSKEGRKQAVSINTDRSASSEPELCGPQHRATQLTGHYWGAAPLSDD